MEYSQQTRVDTNIRKIIFCNEERKAARIQLLLCMPSPDLAYPVE